MNIVQRIGRNSPCPCGSKKKFKRCHGALGPGSLSEQVNRVIAAQEEQRKTFAANHGAVKGIISAEMDEWRFVATGKTLHYAKDWKVFTDFLGAYLRTLLGKEWGERQVKLPIEQQHPIVQWRTHYGTWQLQATRDERGLYATSLGSANAWFRLAYDLYLIDHNAELQKRLVRRLRDPLKFQGARFEVAVAAMMLASGYELRFADEKGPGKHPEFYATHRDTRQEIAVEAKSRHRPGIMGFERDQSPVPPKSFDISRLLQDALEKDTERPLLVFVDLNTPTVLTPQSAVQSTAEIPQVWEDAQKRAWPRGFPSIGAVFYNDASPWFLKDPLPSGFGIWAIAQWPSASRHAIDAKPLLRGIAHGCMQRCNIPLDFPKEKAA